MPKLPRCIVKLLAPIAPHWAEELWHTVLGQRGLLCTTQPWPEFDPEKALRLTRWSWRCR